MKIKSISVYDLQLIPELSEMSIFDIVSLENDKIVHPFLEIMGFDVEYPIHYTVSQHRTLQNKVKIGYVLRGEVNVNRHHLNGPWATLTDKLVAAEYRDSSLCREMLTHMSTSLDYSSFHSSKEIDAQSLDQFPAVLCSPDEQNILNQIVQLEELLLAIRGNPYAEDGNLKMAKDYEDPPYVQRKKNRKKAKQA